MSQKDAQLSRCTSSLVRVKASSMAMAAPTVNADKTVRSQCKKSDGKDNPDDNVQALRDNLQREENVNKVHAFSQAPACQTLKCRTSTLAYNDANNNVDAEVSPRGSDDQKEQTPHIAYPNSPAPVTYIPPGTTGVHDILPYGAFPRAQQNQSNCNLYIRNLVPTVDNDTLSEHFRFYGNVLSTSVMRDIHTGKSLGSGFVRFSTHDEAARAIVYLHNTLLHGSRITIQFASKENNVPVGEARKKIRKLFVRNIPFKTTRADIYNLFSQYGGVAQISIHRDTSKPLDKTQERNIAFVVYNTDGAADLAASKVHNTAPFDTCNGIPLMVKLAEDFHVKPECRGYHNKQQYSRNLAKSNSVQQARQHGYTPLSYQDSRARVNADHQYDAVPEQNCYRLSDTQCISDESTIDNYTSSCDSRPLSSCAKYVNNRYDRIEHPRYTTAPMMFNRNFAGTERMIHVPTLPHSNSTTSLAHSELQCAHARSQFLSFDHEKQNATADDVSLNMHRSMNISRRPQGSCSVNIHQLQVSRAQPQQRNRQHSRYNHACQLGKQRFNNLSDMSECNSNLTSHHNSQRSSSLQPILPCTPDENAKDLHASECMPISSADNQPHNMERESLHGYKTFVDCPLSMHNSCEDHSFCTEVPPYFYEETMGQQMSATRSHANRNVKQSNTSVQADLSSYPSSRLPTQTAQTHSAKNDDESVEYSIDHSNTYSPEVFSLHHAPVSGSSVPSAYRHNPYSFVKATKPHSKKRQ